MTKTDIISTGKERITPSLASIYLQSNRSNRKIRSHVVDRYAQVMRCGGWILTHQGIAFDESGTLIDGQHRLMAIVKADEAVEMLVTRGVPAVGNGGVTAMDVTDCGKLRTVADQLGLNHGVTSAVLTVAALNTIAEICIQKLAVVTMVHALPMLKIFQEDITAVIALIGKCRLFNGASVGTLAFCRRADSVSADDFAIKLANGEGLNKGDPALAIRNYLIKTRTLMLGGGNKRRNMSLLIATGLFNTVNGVPIVIARMAEQGINYYRDRLSGEVDKVNTIMGRTVGGDSK